MSLYTRDLGALAKDEREACAALERARYLGDEQGKATALRALQELRAGVLGPNATHADRTAAIAP